MTFALADANSSSVSTPDACSCARCSSSSAEFGGRRRVLRRLLGILPAAALLPLRGAVMRDRGSRRGSHQEPTRLDLRLIPMSAP